LFEGSEAALSGRRSRSPEVVRYPSHTFITGPAAKTILALLLGARQRGHRKLTFASSRSAPPEGDSTQGSFGSGPCGISRTYSLGSSGIRVGENVGLRGPKPALGAAGGVLEGVQKSGINVAHANVGTTVSALACVCLARSPITPTV